MEDIIEEKEQQQRFYSQVSSGPLLLKMLTTLFLDVIGVKELAISPEDLRCPSIASLKWKYLMCGVLISWVFLFFPTTISTF